MTVDRARPDLTSRHDGPDSTQASLNNAGPLGRAELDLVKYVGLDWTGLLQTT